MWVCPARSGGGSSLPDKPRHQFDMWRVAELVDRSYALEQKTAIDKNPGVPSEACCIARDRNDHGDVAGGELAGLRLCALARRIENHRVVVTQFLRHQWAPEQVDR